MASIKILHGGTAWRKRWLPIFLLVGLAALYVLVVTGGTWRLSQGADYYDWLADAFLSGQSHLKIFPTPDLVTAFERKDYARMPGGFLWDASLYHGRYYLYWGPAPALVCAGWKIMSGGQACHSGAVSLAFGLGNVVWIFLSLGLLDGSQPLRFHWGTRWFVAALFALGSAQLYMLGRPIIYHVAIIAGAFFTLGGFHFFLRYLRGVGPPQGNLLLIGLMMALAVSSRITTLGYAFWLVVIAAWTEWQHPGTSRPQSVVRLLFMIVPLVVSGAALLLYNWSRFGDPFEFGVSYMLTNPPTRQVIDSGRLNSLANIPLNAWLYFFYLPRLDSAFPFVRLSNPYGINVGSTVSVLYTAPLLVFGSIAFGVGVHHRASQLLKRFVQTVSLGTLAVLFPLLTFFGSGKRYEYDFVPVLYLLAYVGLAFVVDCWPRSKSWQMVGLSILALLVAWSLWLSLVSGLTSVALALDNPLILHWGYWQHRWQQISSPTARIEVDLTRMQGYPLDFQTYASQAFLERGFFPMAWGGTIQSPEFKMAAGVYQVWMSHYGSLANGIYPQFDIWVESDSAEIVPLSARRLIESSPNGRIEPVYAFQLLQEALVRVKISFVNDAGGAYEDRNLYISAIWLQPAGAK